MRKVSFHLPRVGDTLRGGEQLMQKWGDSLVDVLNSGDDSRDFSHIKRRKSRWELVKLSGAVCGIEFCYAAETAFVSPILMSLGIPVAFMSTIWCISPLVGLFLSPLLGSLSDVCRSRIGRRRPFIVALSLGIFGGLLLVPNGRVIASLFSSGSDLRNWTIGCTIVGVVLLDFCCDACQAPARTYLLDVTDIEDHSLGLSTFTIMAGLGGSIGYFIGFIPWDHWQLFRWVLGTQVRTVFCIVSIVFVFCVIMTVTSFREIPLDLLLPDNGVRTKDGYQQFDDNYEMGKVVSNEATDRNESNDEKEEKFLLESLPQEAPTLKDYLASIVLMPKHFRILCITNLFSWMSLVCYSLYFTDFVGEAVFEGDPVAAHNSTNYLLYKEGVRFGSFSMAFYSLSCSVYSYHIDTFIRSFGCKNVYIGGQLVYSLGMFIIGLTASKWSVLLFSITAGAQYSTLFTIPYLLVAQYHETNLLASNAKISTSTSSSSTSAPRGIGTDVAIVGSMVFVAQLTLSLVMGSLIRLFGSPVASVFSASLLGAVGAFMASKVIYCDSS